MDGEFNGSGKSIEREREKERKKREEMKFRHFVFAADFCFGGSEGNDS